MNSLVAKSHSSGGFSFINEEPYYEDRRKSVNERLESSSKPVRNPDDDTSSRKNCLVVQGIATVGRLPKSDLVSTSDCSDVSDGGCRTHRSTSSSEQAPKGILRLPRLMAAPKQLSFDLPLSPVPSPKSSCVSHCGPYHMFERPDRVLWMRKDHDRNKFTLLQQRSNSESIFGITPLREKNRRLSVAHIPSRDQALLRKILGPQGLSWINTDRGEAVSKKSVSIAYSNDLEAHKMDDDSEVPLMDGNQEMMSGGRLIKREILHEKKTAYERSCAIFRTSWHRFFFLMIIENELTAAGIVTVGSLSSLCLKSLIVGSTIVLVVFVTYFHIIEVQLFMNANAADDWRVALTLRRMIQIGGELFLCSLCPLPFEVGQWGRGKVSSRTLHSLNVFVSIAMFFRLYWLCRVMLLHSRLFTDASSRSIAGLNRVNFNARFILKTLMTLCPGKMLIIFTAFLWVMAGWILRLCERDSVNIDHRKNLDYISSIWMVAITFLSVGYGKQKKNGTCASSMVVAVVARKLELTRAEKHVHNFMMDNQLTKKLKHSAANVLRETWLIYKFRKKVEKVDYARIRQHQRKFLVAIYEMRKVKRDQRKLAENFVSLGDIAKTSSNTYDLIQDVHETQEGLSLRITAIEHQLSDISREIGMLSELMRSRKKSEASEEQSPSHPYRRRREAVQAF
ncbi:calmodulin binding domain protein [Dictyocaulus viviparus]|uniref:Calmodulin binding domain protein n=1 Tax=Dictyocaulus viviparus TaxID=29172 RepID=A0A0D8XSA5_DICVI|nr:calmodulin binding domain protein [Dictyocaulus viviparus]